MRPGTRCDWCQKILPQLDCGCGHPRDLCPDCQVEFDAEVAKLDREMTERREAAKESQR